MTSLRPALTAEQQERVHGVLRDVRRLARALAAKHRFDADELVSIGYEAAVEAVRTYDPSQGTPFDRFVWYRVRGEMLDSGARAARRSLPALLRALTKAAGETTMDVGEEGDPLTDDDRVTLGRMENACDAFMAAGFAAFVERTSGNAEDAYVRHETHARSLDALEEARAGLDPRDARLIELHYRAERPLHEVAGTLGISERTARRAHHDVLVRLAARLRGRGVVSAPEPAGGP